MATKTVVELVDDIAGGEASETLRFSLDGVSYEIDLNDENAERLRGVLAPYVGVGRRSVGTGRVARRRASSGSVDNPAAVREWAAANGVAVAERGRIPAGVVEQYRAAH